MHNAFGLDGFLRLRPRESERSRDHARLRDYLAIPRAAFSKQAGKEEGLHRDDLAVLRNQKA
jgi:hypothetical protein